MNIDKLFDKAKEILGVESDSKLALHLGITRSAMSLHRGKRRFYFRKTTILRLANILKIAPEEIHKTLADEHIKRIRKSSSMYLSYFMTAPILLEICLNNHSLYIMSNYKNKEQIYA